MSFFGCQADFLAPKKKFWLPTDILAFFGFLEILKQMMDFYVLRTVSEHQKCKNFLPHFLSSFTSDITGLMHSETAFISSTVKPKSVFTGSKSGFSENIC